MWPARPSSATGKRAKKSGGELLGLFLELFHVVVRQAEMVADLVDQHMGDDVAQRLVVFGPVVQYRPAVEGDAVRAFAGLRVPALGDAAALEQAKQVERGLQRQVVHDLVGGKFRDLDDD